MTVGLDMPPVLILSPVPSNCCMGSVLLLSPSMHSHGPETVMFWNTAASANLASGNLENHATSSRDLNDSPAMLPFPSIEFEWEHSAKD